MNNKEQQIKALERQQSDLLDKVLAKQQEIDLNTEDDTSIKKQELDELQKELDLINMKLVNISGAVLSNEEN